ncbi:MAG TPA: hypothetical protein VEY90_08210 [Thermoleophilaceae bacterium]|nr:hypothetical protein [Thermoleophilaceae bacterium]
MSEDAEESEGPAAPNPDGRYNFNCDYLLGDFTEGTEQGFKFVAGGTVENTGNIGIVIRVRARWQQLGSDRILEERRVRLKVGRRKRVNISRLASSGEIDAHQFAEGDCSVGAKIVKTFGRVRD